MGGSRSDVTVQQFIEAHPSGLTVLDVRTPGEFASGHVPGAVPVPLDQLGPAHPAVVGLDKSKPVYVICEVGGRSSRAADMLAAAGYTTINVQGGTAAWIQAGQAVE